MRSTEEKLNKPQQLTISSLYQYVFGNKADPEIVTFESSKKEKKESAYVKSSLLFQDSSPLGKSFSHATKPIYILAPEGIYYIDDTNSTVTTHHLITDDAKKIEQLWKSLGNKKSPFNSELSDVNPKQQRTITLHTKHTPPEVMPEQTIKIEKKQKIKTELNTAQQIKQQKKIQEFEELLNDKELAPVFRKALRDVKAQSLEILLFGNITDSLPETKYTFPSDNQIIDSFNRLESRGHFFHKDIVKKTNEFIIFYKGCKLIADFVEKNNSPDDHVALVNAYKMLVLFDFNTGTNPFLSVEKYLENYGDSRLRHPIHDLLIIDIPSNNPEIQDMPGWRNFIQKFGNQALTFFREAQQIEQRFKRAPIDIEEIILAAVKFQYQRYDQDLELAKVCGEYHLPETNFNKCLELNLIRKKFDNLPNIIFHGKEVGYPNYYIVKLPIDDPRAFILGHITKCCQSVGRDGEPCVIDGVTKENNGFYVLLKNNKNKDKSSPMLNNKINYDAFSIVGQGYAWISKNNNLVFDSWENSRPDFNSIITQMLPAFGKKITENSPKILQISIGHGGKTPTELTKKPLLKCEVMREGYQYWDSKNQSLIYFNQAKLDQLKNKWDTLSSKPFELNEIDFAKFVNIDNILSTKQIKRIERLFMQNNSQKLWNEILDSQKESLAVFKKSIDNYEKEAFEILDLLHKFNLLNKDSFLQVENLFNEVKLNEHKYDANTEDQFSNIATNTEGQFSAIAMIIRLIGREGLLNQKNVKLLLDPKNISYIQSVIKIYKSNHNLLTTDNINTMLKCLEICNEKGLKPQGELLNEAANSLKEAQFLTEKTFKTILAAGYHKDKLLFPKMTKIVDILLSIQKNEVPTNDTLLEAIVKFPILMYEFSITFYSSKHIPKELTDMISNSLLSDLKNGGEKLIDIENKWWTVCPSLYGLGILTIDTFDTVIMKLKNSSIPENSNKLGERDRRLYNMNTINILLNHPSQAALITKDILELETSLRKFIKNKKSNFENSNILFKTHNLQSSSEVDLAKKILKILHGKKEEINLNDTDIKVLNSNNQLLKLISNCESILSKLLIPKENELALDNTNEKQQRMDKL